MERATRGRRQLERELRVGLRLRPRVRGAPLLLQRAGLRAARRAGRGEARLRRSGPRRATSSTTCSSSPSTVRSASPARPSASTSTSTGTELVGPANRSLVHWIRRLVFRGAWLDQRVKEGELDIVFDEDTQHLRLRPARSRRRADRALARALAGPALLRRPRRLISRVRHLSRSEFGASSMRASSGQRRVLRGQLGRARSEARGPRRARRARAANPRSRSGIRTGSSAGHDALRGEVRRRGGSATFSVVSAPRARPRPRRRCRATVVAITVSEPAVLGELATGAEQPLDLVDAAGGEREPRERVADQRPTSLAGLGRAAWPARARARRCGAARPAPGRRWRSRTRPSGSASRQAVASSGRSSTSSTTHSASVAAISGRRSRAAGSSGPSAARRGRGPAGRRRAARADRPRGSGTSRPPRAGSASRERPRAARRTRVAPPRPRARRR